MIVVHFPSPCFFRLSLFVFSGVLGRRIVECVDCCLLLLTQISYVDGNGGKKKKYHKKITSGDFEFAN